jgi:hypothetical protein
MTKPTIISATAVEGLANHVGKLLKIWNIACEKVPLLSDEKFLGTYDRFRP